MAACTGCVGVESIGPKGEKMGVVASVEWSCLICPWDEEEA